MQCLSKEKITDYVFEKTKKLKQQLIHVFLINDYIINFNQYE